MKIGEVASATGVNAATLRAWERRYGLLRPRRTQGGHRDYDALDVARVRAVVALVDAGSRVSEAVRRVSTEPTDTSMVAERTRNALWNAVDSFDEQSASAVLAVAGAELPVADLLDNVLVPTLCRIGAEWRASPRNVAREHFASTIVRSYLVSQLPSDRGAGRPCLGLSPHGEQHDIGLLMAALALAGAGRLQIPLGANTPSASIELLLNELQPSVVLVAACTRRPVARFLETWRRPADTVVIGGGPGFRADDETRLSGPVFHGPYAELPGLVEKLLHPCG